MSAENPLSVFESANVVSVRPGDVLLFRCQKRLDRDAHERAAQVLDATFPHNDFMILDGGQDIAVLRPEPGIVARLIAWVKGGA